MGRSAKIRHRRRRRIHATARPARSVSLVVTLDEPVDLLRDRIVLTVQNRSTAAVEFSAAIVGWGRS